jgi:hypothetical protein
MCSECVLKETFCLVVVCCYPSKVGYGSVDRAPVNNCTGVGANVLIYASLKILVCIVFYFTTPRKSIILQVVTC